MVLEATTICPAVYGVVVATVPFPPAPCAEQVTTPRAEMLATWSLPLQALPAYSAIVPSDPVSMIALVMFEKMVDEAKVLVDTAVSPPKKVCNALQVGMMVWLSAGEPSLRMNVFTVPLTTERPRLAVGFAPVEVPYLLPCVSQIRGD